MAIKVIDARDVDYETAKKEVAGYYQMKGEAYVSDASTDLQRDYELVCKIMDDLESEGKIETPAGPSKPLKIRCFIPSPSCVFYPMKRENTECYRCR